MAVSMIRTALGASQSKTALSTWTVDAGMQVCANQTLLVMVGHDPASTTTVVWNGTTLTKDTSAVNVGNVEGSIHSLLSNPTSATGTLRVSWPGINVTAKTAAAIQVQGINHFISATTGVSAAVTTVSAGTTTAVMSTTTFGLMHAVLEGVSTGTAGTAALDMTTIGQRTGTSGGTGNTNVTLQEVYSLSHAAGSAFAGRLSGITSVDVAGLLAVYDYVESSLPPLTITPAQMSWQAQSPVLRAIGPPTALVILPSRPPIAWSRVRIPTRKAPNVALRLNGSTSRLDVTTDLPSIADWTIMAWCKISVDRNDYSLFFSFGKATEEVYNLETAVDGTTLQIWNGGSEINGSPLLVGQWYHLALTVAGTGAGRYGRISMGS